MDRNTVLRWVVIAAAILLFWKFGLPAITGGGDKVQSVPAEAYVNAPDFSPDVLDGAPGGPDKAPEGELCRVAGNRFEAELSSRGAALTHFWLKDKQYAAGTENGFDLSTTPTHERWRSLRTKFRGEGATDQFKFDRFVWKLERAADNRGCTFTYEDELVRVTKTIFAGERPFELAVDTKIENLTDAPKKHQLAMGLYAFRRLKEVKGSLGKVSPFLTELSCAGGTEVLRKGKDDFTGGWLQVPNQNRYVAVNNSYFTEALMPSSDGPAPTCALLAEDWLVSGQKRDDDDAASAYHAEVAYPVRELQPKEAVSYKQIAYFGPKERAVLAKAGGGAAKLGDVINLGFFSPVAKFLVSVLNFFHDNVAMGNWGVAIILMTVCLRLSLFPLTWKSIKTTIDMRKLKPELDALGEKFKDDAQAKNLATMELYRKRGVNPFGGCLPQLVQMPVWFAMYTTLQTAVEMFHTKFLWFADLSAPDRFYVLPFLLGSLMIVQQRIMPQQPGMDPMQQKMMAWMMPAIFTVMMLFLPAALGVYMLTNSLLGILQQLGVEHLAPRGDKPQKGEIVVKEVPEGALGKGKARV